MEVGHRDALITRHLFLDMPSMAALGIAEIEMPFATGCITPLLSGLTGQGNNRVVDKA
jgi:hypothetical protein